MAQPTLKRRIKFMFKRFKRSTFKYNHAVLGVLAAFIGVVVAFCAIGFHMLIAKFSGLFFGADSTLDASIPAWRIVLVPFMGGLLVALLIKFINDGKRTGRVADVMEANALRDGKLPLKHGVSSALITAVSLGSGASSGREGPVVHMGATLASWLSNRLHLTAPIGRTLLACGVASAVAASFNAPIAGVFFSLEVVIGHYAIHTFAPVVIAGVAGTIVSRAFLGDYPAFIIPNLEITSMFEFPAFILLGVLSAGVAIIFMRSIMFGEDIVEKLPIPPWVLPPIGGLLIGLMALAFPEVLGVGYDATDNALKENYSLFILLSLLLAKTIATAITLACRFGGGVFSPSLYLGAMIGGAFGLVATSIFPELGSNQGVYSIIGMGAVASAVLGAPVSTILIVFEMTGDYSITIAVMIAAAVASLITSSGKHRSFFYWQLERSGLHLADGKAKYLLRSTFARDVADRDFATISSSASIDKVREMFFDLDGSKLLVTDETGQLYGVISAAELSAEAFEDGLNQLIRAEDICRINPLSITADDNLETALRRMDKSGEDHLPVIDDQRNVTGMVHYRDVINVYNRALADVVDEAHSSQLK